MMLRFLLCLCLSKTAFGEGLPPVSDVESGPSSGLPSMSLPPLRDDPDSSPASSPLSSASITPLGLYISELGLDVCDFPGDPVYPHTEVLASDVDDDEKQASLDALLAVAQDQSFDSAKRIHALEYYLYYSTSKKSKVIASESFSRIDHSTFESVADYFEVFKKFDFNIVFHKGLSLVQDSRIPADVREKFVHKYQLFTNPTQKADLHSVLLDVAQKEGSFDFAILLVGSLVEASVRREAQKLIRGMIAAETNSDERIFMKAEFAQRWSY